jgi:hypothetical protein
VDVWVCFEPVWSNLRRSLADLTKQNIGQLTVLVKTRLRRMQYRPGLSTVSSPRPLSAPRPRQAQIPRDAGRHVEAVHDV